MKRLEQALRALTDAVVDECEQNPDFAERVAAALEIAARATPSSAPRLPGALRSGRAVTRDKRTGRRAPGPLDPFELYAASGEDVLRRKLEQLDLEQLKDIVAEHSMDVSRLAMKWKDPDRIVGLIVATVAQRRRKGEVFMAREFRIRTSDARLVKDWDAVIVPVEFVNRGPADTITSIDLRLGEHSIPNSVPFAGREVDRLIGPAPLRLETNDGRAGALYFELRSGAGREMSPQNDAELVVCRASGDTQRASVIIRPAQ